MVESDCRLHASQAHTAPTAAELRRIVILAYNIYGVGGTVRTVTTLASALAAEKLNITIISVRRTSTRPVLGVGAGVALRPLLDVRREHQPKRRSFRSLLRQRLLTRPSELIHRDDDVYRNYSRYTDVLLKRELRSLRDCILICTSPGLNLAALQLVHPSVICIGQEHSVFESHPEGLQQSIRASYGRLHALTCVTASSARRYQHLLEGSRTRVVHVPNATPIPSRGVDHDRCNRVVIAAGRLVYDKGFDLLIRAFSIVSREFPDWRVTIYGEGEEREALQELIFSLEMYNHVFLLPSTRDLGTKLSEADVLAVSSRYESFGMVLVEAMVRCLPAVAFATEGPREILEHERTGLLVSEGDVEGFADALRRLLASEDLRRTLGAAAQTSAQRYSIDQVKLNWLELLRMASSGSAHEATTTDLGPQGAEQCE
jgi:glycosyltransferase involved in cell wall biosynthesis